MVAQEKVCAILFDEMAIKSSTKYNPTNDQVEGVEDYGHLGRSQAQANHALVFMSSKDCLALPTLYHCTQRLDLCLPFLLPRMAP